MSNLCYNCKCPSNMICRGCKSITYCGKECQQKDWPKHRYQCIVAFDCIGISNKYLVQYTKYDTKLEKTTTQTLFNKYLANNNKQNKSLQLTNKDNITIKKLIKAIQLNPDNDASFNNLALYYIYADKLKMALTLQHRAIKLNPKEGSYVLNYCKLLYRLGYITELEEWCNFLFKNHSDVIEQLGIIDEIIDI